MDIYLHQHVLIPNKNEMQKSSKKIWTNAVYEMYNFCFQYNLPWLWSYMWKEWYSDSRWYLWMRAGHDSKISVLKTTILDLVIYIINKKVIVHQKRKFEQIMMGRERPDWKSTFKSKWKLLAKWQLSTEQYITDMHNWICGLTRNNSYSFIFEFKESTESFGQMFWKVDSSLEDNTTEHENCEDLYDRLITATENTLQILKEQKAIGNLK
ncbi:hypothetical protein RhiirA4_472860 [Rhizophagus irregularis]|uniref:Uncharacterized protein n=1 Tax=Rhizophagus irregularis TaxID=588596 RepID=A0A2I1H5Q7_9GLOM|nr:hypothetical protein RhiirA4_472860 [Rhizophagus irregularis]